MYTDIKTIEAAYKAVNRDPSTAIPFKNPVSSFEKGINAAAELTTVVEAINEEWNPDWSSINAVEENESDDEDEEVDGYKYEPIFEFNDGRFSLLIVRCFYSFSGVGSRLCFKSRARAKYAAKQFEDTYNNFLTK